MSAVAVIGLGEAGRVYALGFAARGATVRGHDWAARLDHADGFRQVDALPTAVSGADLAISLVGAASAEAVAAEALPHLTRGAVFADFNTADPTLKGRIGDLGRRHGVEVVDVAVLAPVTRAGARTPLAASGPAARFTELLRPLGAPLDIVGPEVGTAARLKLLRSVFMKGLAALTIESLDAARSADVEPWLRAQIAAELGGDDHVEALLAGTYRHAERREREVRDALDALDAAGDHADMTRATLAWFERLVADQRDRG